MSAKQASLLIGKSALRMMSLGSRPVVSRMAGQLAQYHRIVNPSMSLLIQQQQFNYLSKRNFSAQSPVDELFEKAKSKMNDEIKNSMNCSLTFCVSGKNYYMDCNKERPFKLEVVDTVPAENDATLIADDKTFMKLIKGETKPTMAFMTGKLKIKGDVKKAQKAEKLFKLVQ